MVALFYWKKMMLWATTVQLTVTDSRIHVHGFLLA